jgi:acyl carrier protein
VHDVQDIQTAITDEIARLLTEDGKPVPPIAPDDRLIELGLDSLSFAVLITRLERLLGDEPLDIIESGAYPRTVRELIAVYAPGDAKAAG